MGRSPPTFKKNNSGFFIESIVAAQNHPINPPHITDMKTPEII